MGWIHKFLGAVVGQPNITPEHAALLSALADGHVDRNMVGDLVGNLTGDSTGTHYGPIGGANLPICLSSYTALPSRNANENIHGALHPITTAHDLSAGDLTLSAGADFGIGKLIIVVNNLLASGDITVTGTQVDRNDGSETAAQVSTITVDVATTDTSAADTNSVVKHDLVNAYITDKWFTGETDVVISGATVSDDIDVYHCSFEQFNDSPSVTINTLDINFLTLATGGYVSNYAYTVVVTGDKVDVVSIAGFVRDNTYFAADEYYRGRRGNLATTINGTTDGFFIETTWGGVSKFADVGIKVWVHISS